MRRYSYAISMLFFFLAFGCIAYVVVIDNSKSANTSMEPIALKELASTNEVQIHFSEKPTVLLLFTSWCPYCNEDAPKIVALNEKYKDRFNIYGINLLYRDELSEVKAYVDQHQITYPILLDETGSFHEKYGKTGFPALFFINKQGKVIDQIIGSADISMIEDSFLYLVENFH